jgi:endonuclease/exonuclease/phosphatase family metal-dependent hydrolase
MTANVRLDVETDGENRWTNRRELVAKTFLKYQPDVIACQELSLPQGAYLNKELAQWYAYVPRGGIGANNPETKTALGEMFGAFQDTLASLNTLYYRKDRFDAVDGEWGLVIPEEPQKTAAENTFFTLAVLKRKLPDNKMDSEPNPVEYLIVIDTHLRHDDAFAARCARRLREKLETWSAKYPNSGIVVTGDMNHPAGSQSYQTLVAAPATVKGPPLADTMDYSLNRPVGALSTYHAFRGKPTSNLPTDLIFFAGKIVLDKPAQVLQDHVGARYPSDHYFVLSTLRFKQDK